MSCSKPAEKSPQADKQGSLFTGYSRFYDQVSVLPQQTDDREVRFFAELAGERPKTVLDIGCAEGELVSYLAGLGHEVTGADISPQFLSQAGKRAQAAGVMLQTVLVDVEKGIEPFSGASFDVVYLLDVIEHFRNPVQALDNIRALMHESSRLYIHTPNCMTPARFKRYLLKPGARCDFFDPAQVDDFHFQTYDQMTLEKTLNFVGYTVERIIPTEFNSLGVSKLRRLFPRLPFWAARKFPFLADTLLFECRRSEPIDIDKQIQYWASLSGKD